MKTEQERVERVGGTVPRDKLAISDTYAAAFLVVAGHRVLGVEPEGDGRLGFVFEDTLAARDRYQLFLGNGLVGIQELVAAVHGLKRLLRQAETFQRKREKNEEQR